MSALVLPESLRVDANEKIRRGYELRDELHQKVYAGWWDRQPVRLEMQLRDERTIETVVL